MAADLLIYAIIAGVLVFWLQNILGTKTGAERERDNPFTPPPPPKVEDKPAIDIVSPGTPELPRPKVTKTHLVNRVRIETTGGEDGLRHILAADPRFSLDKFLEGAEAAFEIIVTAFARGDKTTLQPLLTPSVYNDFERVIDDRTTRGETVETKIVAIDRMDILSAEMRNGTAFIALRFRAQENCVVRNALGAIVAGDPQTNTTMIDIWTFGRDVTSASPIWHLYETRDEHTEDHKTPLPESRIV